MTSKKWIYFVIGGVGVILGSIAAVTIIVDPFLHYHKPLSFLEYPLLDERYQNDGIARYYDYQAIITGTSMTQNFKPSEFEELWGTKTIKISTSGASYNEVSDNIKRALRRNPEVQYVLRSIDGNYVMHPADEDEYEGYPEYLYDENPFNDVEYLLNKEVIPKTIAVINFTQAGNITPSMDEYGSWSQYKAFGMDTVLSSSVRLPDFEKETVLTEQDYKMIEENIQQNVIDLALEYPQITFYVFYPPYSICYWEALEHTKQIRSQLEAERYATELLTQIDNIQVYAFADDVDMVSDLDNYTDSLHYGEWINSYMLYSMAKGQGKLTTENYNDYYEEVIKLYLEYDYSLLRKEKSKYID